MPPSLCLHASLSTSLSPPFLCLGPCAQVCLSHCLVPPSALLLMARVFCLIPSLCVSTTPLLSFFPSPSPSVSQSLHHPRVSLFPVFPTSLTPSPHLDVCPPSHHFFEPHSDSGLPPPRSASIHSLPPSFSLPICHLLSTIFSASGFLPLASSLSLPTPVLPSALSTSHPCPLPPAPFLWAALPPLTRSQARPLPGVSGLQEASQRLRHNSGTPPAIISLSRNGVPITR